MNPSHIKEAVRRGIAAIGKTPAAFLFIDETPECDWTWDLSSVHDVPVFYGVDLTCSWCHAWSSSVPFIPIGRDNADISSLDRKRFAEAYDDYIRGLERQIQELREKQIKVRAE